MRVVWCLLGCWGGRSWGWLHFRWQSPMIQAASRPLLRTHYASASAVHVLWSVLRHRLLRHRLNFTRRQQLMYLITHDLRLRLHRHGYHPLIPGAHLPLHTIFWMPLLVRRRRQGRIATLAHTTTSMAQVPLLAWLVSFHLCSQSFSSFVKVYLFLESFRCEEGCVYWICEDMYKDIWLFYKTGKD